MQRATTVIRSLAGSKEPVRVASTANLALSGLLTVDGIVTVAGNRVLVKNQTDATENGVYTASEGAWQRAVDCNSDRTLIGGMTVAVFEGTAHGGDIWILETDRPDIGDDNIVFSLFLNTSIADAINLARETLIAEMDAIIATAMSAGKATQPEAEAGVSNVGWMTPLRVAQYVSAQGGFGDEATMAQLLAGTDAVYPDAKTLNRLLIAESLIQNNATDATNDIDVLLDGAAVATKRLDAAWAAGTNQGGLDTGTKANSTTYHLWLLLKNSDGTLDALFSTQPINPTVPTGYTKMRSLGAVITNGSGVIRPFLQSGDTFSLISAVQDVTAASNGAVATLRSLTVPQGVKVIARVFMGISGSGGGYGSAWDGDLGLTASGHRVLPRISGSSEAGVQINVMTSANRQIYTSDDSTTPLVSITTLGWSDPRVRRHAI